MNQEGSVLCITCCHLGSFRRKPRFDSVNPKKKYTNHVARLWVAYLWNKKMFDIKWRVSKFIQLPLPVRVDFVATISVKRATTSKSSDCRGVWIESSSEKSISFLPTNQVHSNANFMHLKSHRLMIFFQKKRIRCYGIQCDWQFLFHCNFRNDPNGPNLRTAHRNQIVSPFIIFFKWTNMNCSMCFCM